MPRTKPLLIEIGQGLSIIAGPPTISFWNNEKRPKNPRTGTFGYNTQTTSLEYWDGKSWYEAPLRYKN